MRALPLLVLLLMGSVRPASAQVPSGRTVAVTVDDLPYAGGPQRLEDAAYVTNRMTAALVKYGAPATAFVTGIHILIPGEVDERLDMLRRWRDAGARLENHGNAHLSYNDAPADEYLDDIIRGNLLPEALAREKGDSVRWFRAPYNQTGRLPEQRERLEDFLTDRGWRLAPFTVEHADFVINGLYVEALARGDEAYAKKVADAYLAQLDSAFAFAERLSVETFGEEIPHVFLIHSNRLNADYLGAMLQRLQERGYRFIALDEAVSHPAYLTPDIYEGGFGISWLHRWRVWLGLENRMPLEPDYPTWIYDDFRRSR